MLSRHWLIRQGSFKSLGSFSRALSTGGSCCVPAYVDAEHSSNVEQPAAEGTKHGVNFHRRYFLIRMCTSRAPEFKAKPKFIQLMGKVAEVIRICPI